MLNKSFANSKGPIIENNLTGTLFSFLKGIAAAYLITIPAFIIFSVILTNTAFPEKFIQPAVVVITIVSVLFAGSLASRGRASKGWLNGALVGLVYIAILFFLSSLVYSNFTIDKYVVTLALIAFLTGAIGGIMGINMKARHGGKHKYKRSSNV